MFRENKTENIVQPPRRREGQQNWQISIRIKRLKDRQKDWHTDRLVDWTTDRLTDKKQLKFLPDIYFYNFLSNGSKNKNTVCSSYTTRRLKSRLSLQEKE